MKKELRSNVKSCSFYFKAISFGFSVYSLEELQSWFLVLESHQHVPFAEEFTLLLQDPI
jgi:hypothetical protein